MWSSSSSSSSSSFSHSQLLAALKQSPMQEVLEEATPTPPLPLSPKKVPVSVKEVKKELLEWVQRATEGYEEVTVKDFTHSWKNGMAFSAIIHRHR